MSTIPLRDRSILAAQRWMRLSSRARQLKICQNFTSIVTSTSRPRPCNEISRSVPNRIISKKTLSSTPVLRAAPTRQPRLPDKPARTRFAPSPTGYLHIGGLRTALFSFLLARRTGGQFLLRIEDTDQKRLVTNAEERLYDDLNWAGLQWDEGPGVEGPYGPYRQSERTHIYQEHAQRLLDEGSAYRCFCTPQASGIGAQAAYVTSGCYQNCSSRSLDESRQRAERNSEAFTVRLRQPNRTQKRVYPDLVYGKIQPLKRSPAAPQIASEDDTGIDAADTILMKSDGTPTYHFANVVDDHLMKISHVIRGVEWMASTPLHYDIYSAFGWEPPHFAHVPLLVDQNKAKLSKRNQDLALDVASMRDQHGVLPYTLNNFLALLGWSNPTDNDVMDMDALVDSFDLKFTRGNTMVRMEKLWFLQKQHVALRCERARTTQSLPPIVDVVSKITAEVRRRYPESAANFDRQEKSGASRSIDSSDALTTYCTAILLADSKVFQNAAQFVERNRYFFSLSEYQISVDQKTYNEAETITPGILRFSIREAIGDYFEFRLAPIYHDESPSGANFTLGSNGQLQADAFAVLAEGREFSIELAKHAWNAAIPSYERCNFPFLNPRETNTNFRAASTGSTEPISRFYCPALDIRELATLATIGKGFAKLDIRDKSAEAEQVISLFKRFTVSTPLEFDGKYIDPEKIAHKALVDAVEVAVNRYRVYHTAMNKYLREKLCGGLPGPSMPVVMAIMGHDEVLRRLGFLDKATDVSEGYQVTEQAKGLESAKA